MQYGIALPYTSARQIAQLAQLAEQAGWDGCYVGDAIWCEDPLIGLAAAAVLTERIRLGSMVLPAPLRQPWKLASESLALDRLSNGRLTLGLGMGATWMGWQSFPDIPTDAKTRAGLLDETIDLLTLFYQRRPFDYDGQHYHLKLTLLDELYYPPAPIQQPRIPLWVVGVLGRQRSMARAAKCDGLFLEKDPRSPLRTIGPDEVRQARDDIAARRTLSTPFDIIVEGKPLGQSPAEARDILAPWIEAGATWWIDGLWTATPEQAAEHIRRGPPQV